MPLPHNEWIDILDGCGPGTWKLVKALFRERGIDADNWCYFTLPNPDARKAEDPYGCELAVRLEGVSRTSTGFLIAGFIEEIDGDEWESLANQFKASYDPETRKGQFLISDDIVI